MAGAKPMPGAPTHICSSSGSALPDPSALTPPHAARRGETIPPLGTSAFVPGEVVVKLRRGEAAPRLTKVLSHQQARILGQIAQLDVLLLRVADGDELAASAQLRRDPAVEYAEPNYLARLLDAPRATGPDRLWATAVPNDELWSQQWSFNAVRAPQAWDITHSVGIIIAFIDTGIYVQHSDLKNVLWTNPGEIPGNGIDDDGNGKIDDVHGWHFFQQWNGSSWEPYENSKVDDDNGHGTHVTGIAAAETNNGIGVAGLSWGAQAMAVKVLDQFGEGSYYDIAAGIKYAADNGARVINISVGGAAPSQLLQDAVTQAYAKGALLVAAAGNFNTDVYYPAACDHVMAVAATGHSDERWTSTDYSSNYGPAVDIAAPGLDIRSTWPFLPYLYFDKTGTSMAAPHVSGAAALLWTLRPDWSSDQVAARLESQADDVNAATHPDRDVYLGWGRLNVQRALLGLAPGPTPSPTPTRSPTPTATPSPSPSSSPTSTLTEPAEPTSTGSPTETATSVPTPSPTPTITPSPTGTVTRTVEFHIWLPVMVRACD